MTPGQALRTPLLALARAGKLRCSEKDGQMAVANVPGRPPQGVYIIELATGRWWRYDRDKPAPAGPVDSGLYRLLHRLNIDLKSIGDAIADERPL